MTMDQDWLRHEIATLIAANGFTVIALDHLCYTAGLYESYQHPEVCVLGLDVDRGMSILTAIGIKVRQGERFVLGTKHTGILQTYKVSFRDVSYASRDAWLEATNVALYEGRSYPVLQCVYPDEDGLFPFEAGCHEETVYAQSWEALQAFVNYVTDVN